MNTPRYYGPNEVGEILGWGPDKCYKIIRELNLELETAGIFTRPGQVPSSYFNKRFGFDGALEEVADNHVKKGVSA